MTTAEHQLIVEMFKNQRLIFDILIELLKSRGVVQSGDLAAFDALVSQSEAHRDELERQVGEEYQRSATILGVQTGLPYEG